MRHHPELEAAAGLALNRFDTKRPALLDRRLLERFISNASNDLLRAQGAWAMPSRSPSKV